LESEGPSALRPEEDPVGEYIRIQGIYFKVVGVFSTQSEGEEADEKTQTIFVPFSTFQQAFNRGNVVGWFSMTSKGSVPASEVERKVIQLLAQRHHIAPDDEHAIGHWNTEKEFKKMGQLFIGIRVLFWFVGIFTLLAGVIGVSNIMLVIVKERTREIGIRRAIGATPLGVIGQIVLESVLLTTFAGYWGLVAGVGVVELVSSALEGAGGKVELFRAPEVNLAAAVIALGVLVLSGMLAGLLPGYRAVRIKPIEAIRSE
jgi:putative ABC transport system permease protein